MKKLILLAALCLPMYAADSIKIQEAKLNKVLWKLQKHMSMDTLYMTLHVKTRDQMKMKGAWGSEGKLADSTTDIEILAAESYPKQIPAKVVAKMQRVVVMHECLHIYMTMYNLPSEYQDTLIESLLLIMEKP